MAGNIKDILQTKITLPPLKPCLVSRRCVLERLEESIDATGMVPRLILVSVFVTLYLFHPGLLGSNLYDLHENCFLAPLMLWLFYFIEKKAYAGITLMTLLVFAVKEDAAMYVAVTSLFILVSGRQKRTGVVMIAASAICFIASVRILNTIGEGVMFWRYDNFIPDKSWGIVGIPLTILTNPGYFISEICAPKKLYFVLTVIPSLGFLPFFQRHFSNLILLIPVLVMNLMPDYIYQHQLPYQYHYGTTVFMLYMIILHISGKSPGKDPATDSGEDSGKDPAKVKPVPSFTFFLCVAVLCSGFFTTQLLRNRFTLITYLKENKQLVDSIKAELDRIPRDASVQASTFFTTYLAARDEVYDLTYNQEARQPYTTDYIVIDLRPGMQDEAQKYIDLFALKNTRLLHIFRVS